SSSSRIFAMRERSASWLCRAVASSAPARLISLPSESTSPRTFSSASSIDASVSRPLHLCAFIASPLGDRRAARRDPKLGLELAAPLHRDGIVLDDPVILLVRRDATERRLVDPHAPARDVAHAAVLLVADRQRQPRAVGRDRLDDQVESLRLRILVGHAPDAGQLAGPGYDAELVLLLERGAQRAEVAD